MDSGTPSPTILSNDNELFITFYSDDVKSLSFEPQERNTVYDSGIIVLKFKMYLHYNFGIPGDETIHKHPYSKLGMRSYSFYELKNSNLIKELQEIQKGHVYYDADKWKTYKHYVLTFHDNMFECIAEGFEIREETASLHNKVSVLLNELSSKHL